MSVKRVRLTKIKPRPDADERKQKELARRRERRRQYVARSTKRPPAERDQTAMRTCLHCRASFKSWGPGNRICGYCKTLSLFGGYQSGGEEADQAEVRGNAKREMRVAAIAAKAFAT